MMIEIADKVVVGYASPGGQLDMLLKNYSQANISRLQMECK
jgi:hypothetical protein